MTMIRAVEEELLALGKKHQNMVMLHGDLSGKCGVRLFADAFPERTFHFGLSTSHMVAAAAGFTARGKLPFVCGLSSLIAGGAWEQVRTAVCYQNLNVKFLGVDGGFARGVDGVGLQSGEDIALMRVIPNMKVVAPADGIEAAAVCRALFNEYGPTYVRLFSEEGGAVSSGHGEFVFGRSTEVREGDDVCVFSCGIMTGRCCEAADELLKENVRVRVVHLASIKPLDVQGILRHAAAVKTCAVVEEHSVYGGLGGAVAEVLSGSGLMVRRIGIPDVFGESVAADVLYKKYRLDVPGIVAQVRELV